MVSNKDECGTFLKNALNLCLFLTKPRTFGSFSYQAGGFDNLLLDSLYEDSAARRTMELHSAGYNTSYGYDPSMQIAFDQQQQFDPFAISNNIPPPTNVQLAQMAQQEQMVMHQQQMPMMMPMPGMEAHHGMGVGMEPYNPYAASQQQTGGYFNPFDDPFSYPQPAAPAPPGKNNNNNNNNTFI